jgi:hypothetical protein
VNRYGRHSGLNNMDKTDESGHISGLVDDGFSRATMVCGTQNVAIVLEQDLCGCLHGISCNRGASSSSL